jgi:hypothetical protein
MSDDPHDRVRQSFRRLDAAMMEAIEVTYDGLEQRVMGQIEQMEQAVRRTVRDPSDRDQLLAELRRIWAEARRSLDEGRTEATEVRDELAIDDPPEPSGG